MERVKELVAELGQIKVEILDEIARMNKIIKKLPEGELDVVIVRGEKYQYYWRFPKENNRKRKYLSQKKDAKLIAQLGDKRYAKEAIKNLEQNLKAIDIFLAKVTDEVGVYLADKLEEKGIPTTSRTCLSQKAKGTAWVEKKRREKKEDMTKNASYYEKYKSSQKFPTLGGDVVRSKGEGLIADILFSNQIPYAYEDKLEFGDEFKYPDFAIYDPVSDRVLYYEHFGRIDKEDYLMTTIMKLHFYLRHGLKPGVDFIFTFETEDEPLTTKMVYDVLAKYVNNVALKAA